MEVMWGDMGFGNMVVRWCVGPIVDLPCLRIPSGVMGMMWGYGGSMGSGDVGLGDDVRC